MRPENVRMKNMLKQHGIICIPWRIHDGSMRGCWKLYGKGQPWTEELRQRLIAIGFVDYDNNEISVHAGNGGSFQVFVRGFDNLTSEKKLETYSDEYQAGRKEAWMRRLSDGIITQEQYDDIMTDIELNDMKALSQWYQTRRDAEE